VDDFVEEVGLGKEEGKDFITTGLPHAIVGMYEKATSQTS